MRGPEGVPIGRLRRVSINNVVVSNADSRQATIITGIPGHQIEDVRFSGIYLLHHGGGTKQDATIDTPELEADYPDPNRFGPMPAHGFFLRHVKGIVMRDIEIRAEQEDLRPAFILDDVQGADFSHIKLPPDSASSWSLKNVADFSLGQSRPFADTYIDSVTRKIL
jgi:hypothetical protein